jgi:hypothetical protein
MLFEKPFKNIELNINMLKRYTEFVKKVVEKPVKMSSQYEYV